MKAILMPTMNGPLSSSGKKCEPVIVAACSDVSADNAADGINSPIGL